MNYSVCSSSVDVVREWICLSSFFSLSVSSCTFHPRCSLTTSSWWELQGCYGGWDILLLYTRMLLFVLPYIHTHHSLIYNSTLSFPSPIEIKISHRPTQKCMWVAWIMDMRLELPLNSSFVKWRSTANLNTHYTYTALCWCGRSFIRSVWLSLLWVRPIGWHTQTRYACSTPWPLWSCTSNEVR